MYVQILDQQKKEKGDDSTTHDDAAAADEEKTIEMGLTSRRKTNTKNT
jgi:hypothetical protein